MSASRLAVSGAHSGGLATTVFPAASAGAMRQVASISGAFHGVITAVTPAGSQETRSACPETSRFPGSRWPSQSAKNSKLCATRGITLRRCERSSEPLSQVSTWASSSMRARTPAATARSTAARSAGGVAAQPANAAFAARTASATSAVPPRATSAMGASSIGEKSVKVPAEATRWPPIQWRVSTATPATCAVHSFICLPRGRSALGGLPGFGRRVLAAGTPQRRRGALCGVRPGGCGVTLPMLAEGVSSAARSPPEGRLGPKYRTGARWPRPAGRAPHRRPR